jgi:putative RNA 2'-phosphotransferase
MKNLEKLSKFLALVLRHEPLEFGVQLDDEGFTDVDYLWLVIQEKYGDRYTWDDLETVVAGDADGKKRYELRDKRIRAMYGHNRTVNITYEPATPPEILYHGTNKQALAGIRKDGLQALGRQYVHLTTNTARAEKVAARRGEKIILLTIRASEAHQAGIVFHHAETEHYLAKHIPAAYIDIP